jgi:hypothetical protein
MKYSLILQFRTESLTEFDKILDLEDSLIVDLATCANVDGHDFGCGTANIFIYTNEPEETFRRARKRLVEEGRLDDVTAAQRPMDSKVYTVIWPEGSTKPFSLI